MGIDWKRPIEMESCGARKPGIAIKRLNLACCVALIWMRNRHCRHGHRLEAADRDGIMRCPETGYRYKEVEPGVLRCLDLDEESPLPAEFSVGSKSYRQFKEEINDECSVTRS